jgi:hypothetical protein
LCIIFYYIEHTTSTAADANYTCASPPTNGSQERKNVISCSVTIFFVASILFFTIGFLCGNFYQKKKTGTNNAAASGGQTQAPCYGDVVLKQKEVELKENVAYGQIRL